jgi:hypothetical protein
MLTRCDLDVNSIFDCRDSRDVSVVGSPREPLSSPVRGESATDRAVQRQELVYIRVTAKSA